MGRPSMRMIFTRNQGSGIRYQGWARLEETGNRKQGTGNREQESGIRNGQGARRKDLGVRKGLRRQVSERPQPCSSSAGALRTLVFGAFQRANQSVDHAADFLCVADQRFGLMFGEQFDSLPDQHLRFQFCPGGVCRPQMLDVVRCRVPAVSFGNVGRDRHGRLPDLIPKHRLLGLRESLRRSITTHSEVH